MIKHQIETMLNIKGKEMPSVEEEFGSAGNIYIFVWTYKCYSTLVSINQYFIVLYHILEVSYNNSGPENIDQVIQNMNNVVIANDPVEDIHHHGSRYSDYTEKLQSLYPKCKFLCYYTLFLSVKRYIFNVKTL